MRRPVLVKTDHIILPRIDTFCQLSGRFRCTVCTVCTCKRTSNYPLLSPMPLVSGVHRPGSCRTSTARIGAASPIRFPSRLSLRFSCPIRNAAAAARRSRPPASPCYPLPLLRYASGGDLPEVAYSFCLCHTSTIGPGQGIRTPTDSFGRTSGPPTASLWVR